MRIKCVVSAVLSVLLLLSCSGNDPLPLHKSSRLLMGTLVDVAVIGEEERAKAATESIFNEIKRIENLTSFYNPSELTKINDNSGKGPTKASGELLGIIGEALRIARLTGGAFDPTVGALSRLWQFSGPGEPHLPPESEIKEALTKVGWNRVRIDTEAETILLPDAGMALDLGGIAKGYTLNRIAEILSKWGITSALVNIGGDILAAGEKQPGKPWLVGVEDPRNPRGIVAVAPLKDRIIVTSGDYERFFTKDEKRYHHIIDPRSGYPSDKLRSVTIVGPIGGTLQPAGTATFVLGVEEGLKFIRTVEGTQALLIDAEGNAHLSEGAGAVFETK
ncbi:MAG: FAD:protein FMN transferase [Desulfomonile tiedjei]|uniref:FAD:protein FMN transferase n=1 Tax=Desulfomonile tiedjei TaxID=2358 RepID=A0A9D6V198_9BACT|nr:FAD:protein FMN transferase [Desulfomonile tiedjei]